MKQFATWFTHGVPGGARLRAAIYQARTGVAVLSEVERFFVHKLEAGEHEATGSDPAQTALAQPFPEAALLCD